MQRLIGTIKRANWDALSELKYSFSAGTSKPTTREPDIGIGQEGRKRKQNDSHADDEEARNVQHHLVRALDRNGKLVSSQLEAQNMHFEQDREQRKDHVNSLVAVLTKLADALGRIADKL